MASLIWSVLAASGLLFGQLQNFGPDPEEKKRGEKMISQSELGIALNEKMVALSDKMVRQQRIAIGIAILALLIGLIALFRQH